MTSLVAYENGEYVDSITTNDKEALVDFRQDFHMCKVEMRGVLPIFDL